MTTPREFNLATVLSITTGDLLCPFSDVHGLIEFVADGPVWTHQIPRATDPIREAILRQHPDLADVETPEWDHDGNVEAQIAEWLAPLRVTVGDTRSLTPMDDFEWIEPVSEAAALIGR